MKRIVILTVLIIYTTLTTLVFADKIEDLPLISGTEYNIRVDGDNTELSWILHIINKGNRTLYGNGLKFDFSISESHKNKTLICKESFISDSTGEMNEWPLQKKEDRYIIPYSGTGVF